MVESDADAPNNEKSAAIKQANTPRSTGSVFETSGFPDSPKTPTKPPVSNFKTIVAKLVDEFDQVHAMLDKEINHRVHLEAKVASLTAELERPAEMAARRKKSELAEPPEATAKIDDVNPGILEGPNTQDDKQEGNRLLLQKAPSRISLKSDQSESKDTRKHRKDEQLEDLELIRGWKVLGSLYDDSEKTAKTFVEKAGIIRAHARKIVQSTSFDAICSIFIIYNAALLGAAADYAAVNHSDPEKPPMFYRMSDRVCSVWFLLELIVRLSSEGIWYFFTGPLWTWNVFDFIVVVSDVFMTILDIIATDTKLDLSFLRMLRVLRVTRAIRVVRLVRFFKELRMMVFSVLRSGTSLLWSLILFGMIHYIFGIFLMQNVNNFLWDKYAGDFTSVSAEVAEDIKNFKRYWGSLTTSFYTMYACMSGGASWIDVADDLREISWLNGVVLGFFIFFCTVVVMNIITGIFVDTAIQSAQSDREEIIQEQIHSQESELAKLKQAFLEADEDGSACITLAEFQQHLLDPRVRAHLASIGLEVHEAMGLFKLLDIDGSGNVGVEEFVIGCMRLKGSAKSIDLATLMYENKRMVEQHSYFHEFCESKFTEILAATASLRSEIKPPPSAPPLLGECHYVV